MKQSQFRIKQVARLASALATAVAATAARVAIRASFFYGAYRRFSSL